MKPIHFTPLLIFLLTACAPAQTLTPTPPATQAPQAAPTATATARPTVTPTPTEDPLAGAPEGATGKDKDDNWIRPAINPDGTPLLDSHGKQVYETWYTFPSGPNGETVSGWFEDHVKDGTLKGGIPLVDHAETGWVKKSAMPIYIKVKDGVIAPYLQHITNSDFQGGLTYSVNVFDVLLERFYGKPLQRTTGSERANFFANFPDNFSITLTDAQGNPHTIYGDTSFTVVLVEPEDISEPDFDIPNRSGPATRIISVTSYDDEKHAVTILVANTKPNDQMSNQDFIDTILRPLGHVLVFPDQLQKAWWNDPGKAGRASSLSNMALKGEHPYFILSDSP